MVKNDDQEMVVPISQIRDLIIGPDIMSLSAKLIRELSYNNVNIIICDEKHEPACSINGLNNNFCSAGHIMDQVKWTEECKKMVWQNIVVNKITNQINLLQALDITVDPKLFTYVENVLPDDVSNREGQAARLYFSSLFGADFIRHAPDEINAALNYGYTILQSSFSRVIALHGYNTSLGIKHCSRINLFNLSCDLMEPFRPFVDKICFLNKENKLDRDYKILLVEMLNSKIRYNNKNIKMADAIDNYSVDVLSSLNNKMEKLPEVSIGG